MTRSYRATRTIRARPETVWALLTDAESYADWNASVVSLEGPIELGGRIRLVSTVDPKRTFRLSVTEMRPPNHMMWSSGMPLGLFTGRRTYSIEERGDGSSEFTMAEELTGPLARLITKAIPDLTDSFATFVDSLTAAAETRETP